MATNKSTTILPASGTLSDKTTVSATLFINQKTKSLIKQGKTIYRLGFGESPFPVPKVLVKALKKNASKKSYLDVSGHPKLKKVIADYYQNRHKLSFTPDQIIVGPGSKQLIFLAQLAAGSDLIIPSPSWVSYAPQAKSLGLKVHWIKTDFDSGWRLKADQLIPVLDQTEGRRLLILNYPNNPTGTTYSENELRNIAKVARQYNLVIISDEIYEGVNFETKHKSLAHFYPEGTIISSSLSKWCGAGGWRIGYLAIPKNLSSLQKKIIALASETHSCVSSPIQYAAIEAFKNSAEVLKYRKETTLILKAISQYMYTYFQEANIDIVKPDGGFYMFLSFEKFRAYFEKRQIFNSKDLCEYLLDNLGIALLPGSTFGRPEEEFTCRLAFVDFNGKKTLKNVHKLSKEKNINTFIESYCPKIKEATCILSDWTQTITNEFL